MLQSGCQLIALTLFTAAQRVESSYLLETRRHVEELSGIEAVLDGMKRLAEDHNIDIEKAMLNAPQEEMIGAELGKYLSLRRRRAICYGVMVMSLSISSD